MQQTQDSDSDLPSVDVNSGNVQEHESTPAANEAPSANPGNEQEQKQQQSLLVENQEPFDTAGNDLKNRQRLGKILNVPMEPVSSS